MAQKILLFVIGFGASATAFALLSGHLVDGSKPINARDLTIAVGVIGGKILLTSWGNNPPQIPEEK